MKNLKIANKKLVIIVTIVTIILTGSLPFSSFMIDSKNTAKREPKIKSVSSSNSVLISPIVIRGNNDWAETAENNIWCSGSGSFSDPYVIDSIEIDGQNSGNCIEIEDTDVYFKIENCNLYRAGGGPHAGIYLADVRNAQLINNNCSNNYGNGIFLSFCNDCKITKNTANNNGNGISLIESNNIFITENTVRDNGDYGIIIHNSYRTNISKNIIDNNGIGGIYLSWSLETIVSGNILDSNYYNGIFLESSDENYFFNNQIKETEGDPPWDPDPPHPSPGYPTPGVGIAVDRDSNDNVFYNNLIFHNIYNAIDAGSNNKWDNGSIGNYWDDYIGIDDDDDGIGDQPYELPRDLPWEVPPPIGGGIDNFPIMGFDGRPIFIDGSAAGAGAHNWTWARSRIWCTGSGTLSDPYIIENLEINAKGGRYCIEIINSDVYFIIRNCKAYGTASGLIPRDGAIHLEYVTNGNIFNNQIYNNKLPGISIQDAHNNNITHNSIQTSYAGFTMGGHFPTPGSYNYIAYNEIGNCVYGFYIGGAYNIYNENELNNNHQGIYLFKSNRNYFSGNSINFNEHGINLAQSNNNDFFENKIMHNGREGVDTDSSTNNVFVENMFMSNTINAIDTESNNIWDNGVHGNLWHDHTDWDLDTNHDYIADIPYMKNGVVDNYPLIAKPDGLKTLIFVHGFSIEGISPGPSNWQYLRSNLEEYYDKIIEIRYYQNPTDMGGYFTTHNSIDDISMGLRNYLIEHYYEITDNIDFICHSMGGLVVRNMIKLWYRELCWEYDKHGRRFRISHVAMLGTPNKGVSYGWAGLLFNCTQLTQMAIGSWFLKSLNQGTVTPRGSIIKYSTYRGQCDFLGICIGLWDGVVGVGEVSLVGARNWGPYYLNHDSLRDSIVVLWALKYDLGLTAVPLHADAPNPLIPPIPQPGVIFPTTNKVITQLDVSNTILDPSSVMFNINPQYQMVLVPESNNIYEVNLPLPEGVHHYTITANDFHGNVYQWEGEITILEDDTTFPNVNFYQEDLLVSDEEAIEGVLLEWNITDESGIGEASVELDGQLIASYGINDNISDSFLLASNIPKTYTLDFWVKDNDNDPGHQPSEPDWLEIHYQKNFTIFDDDTTPPNYTIDYVGFNQDGNPGKWEINVFDEEEGLDNVRILVDNNEIISDQNLDGILSKSYSISVPKELGLHEIEIEVKNNDKDWEEDQEFVSSNALVYITDDDTTPPVINLNYIGSGFDNNPGYFEWNAWDVDSGLIEIEVRITYSSTDGSEDFEISFPGSSTGKWDIPSNLGYYTLAIFARDSDDDRTLLVDSLTTQLTNQQEIIDDDIGSPELSDLEITPGIFEINISLVAIDESGIKNITLLINGEVIEPISLIQNGDAYFFTVSNNWLFEKGFSEVEVLVEDSDDDRPNDSLISSISGSFKNILNQMYEYVDWQVEELKDFIEENLCSKVSGKIVKKLSQAQEMLIEAFDLIENGNITSGVRKVYLAKIYINIAEHKTSLYNKINRINYDNALYIIQFLHDIRNNIVYLKGASTGVKQGVDISYIEVELLNLVDLIEPNIKFRSLTNNIRVAAEILEIAIIRISLNKNPKGLLCYVQGKLEYAICKVDHLLRKERISQELADYIINKLSQQIEAIETVKDSLVGYESLKF